MSRIFRIHPAFGIARVGNASRDTAFVGPELPGVPANFNPATGTFGPFSKTTKRSRRTQPAAPFGWFSAFSLLSESL